MPELVVPPGTPRARPANGEAPGEGEVLCVPCDVIYPKYIVGGAEAPGGVAIPFLHFCPHARVKHEAIEAVLGRHGFSRITVDDLFSVWVRGRRFGRSHVATYFPTSGLLTVARGRGGPSSSEIVRDLSQDELDLWVYRAIRL